MKKLLLSFSLLFSVLTSDAQQWAAPGATWYYEMNNFMSSGYERITKIGDTLINGKDYDVLDIYHRWYTMWNNQTGSYTLPHHYVRADSNVVYFFNPYSQQDYVLYDFNAQAGDSWLSCSRYNIGTCDTGTIHINSVTTTIINGDTLDVLVPDTTWSSSTGLIFPQRILEKIGGLSNLFAYPGCVADLDQGWGLRCYYDSTGFTYHSSLFANSCDDMMSIEEHDKFDPLVLYYDQASGNLQLTSTLLKPGCIISIYDAQGRLLLNEACRDHQNVSLKFSPNSSGVYYVQLADQQNHTGKAFAVIQ